MDTKSKRVFVVLFMCCIACLNAQHIEKTIPDEFKNNLYQIMFQQVSPNGKWVAFKKAYEKTNDTLVLVNAEKRNEVILEVGEVGNFFFAANNTLFYQKSNEIIQYNIPAKKQQVWKNISEYYYWEDQKKFILFEKSAGHNSIFIVDEDGEELERFINAQMIKIVDQSVIIITKSEAKFLVWRYDGERKSQVFKYDNKINGILNVSKKGIVFIEESPTSKQLKICYFDIEHQRIKKLSDSWNRKIQQVKTFFIDDSHQIFLKTSIKKDVVPKEVVDIWYGNAKDLRTKFYEKDQEMIDIIWNPEIGTVTELANSKCTTYFSFGNNKDILCLDEFKNEDFTGKDKSYPIFKYQIENKDYSEVGDLGSSIIVDRNGRYLLSKQLNQWHLYDISEMKQKILPHFESVRASFTKDSKSIVFEGKGSISIYNISSNKVERIDLEPGCQIEIVTSEKEYLAGNLSIYRNVIDVSKPIVVKLINPDNYTMGLAVIRKGKVQYIERNIAHRINSVKWNRSISKIVYVVEDVNLPPQLRSYKKQSEILYDSNLEDKIARTIQSTIYTYKNSRGQNIQGVLLYPVSLDPKKKYPLIVNIYENQSKLRNQFLLDGFSGSTDAFNIRYYLKRDYFVFLPDIIYDERGPSVSNIPSCFFSKASLLILSLSG